MKKLNELLPKPSNWSLRPPIQQWAIGVTTAPRKEPTLWSCLDSLLRTGFGPVYLFAEPGTEIRPNIRQCRLVYLVERVLSTHAWPNFYLGLWELVLRHPDADVYMMGQDDALFYDGENIREYLEKTLWPQHPTAHAVSLYCSSAYSKPENGWYKIDTQWTWGAVCMIWPREFVYSFLTSHAATFHRMRGRKRGVRNIDSVIGRWQIEVKGDIWYPCPSLVQHIGKTSTLTKENRFENKKRHANRFVGDEI